MSKLTWDQTGERFYETGVKMGVLYPQGESGTYPKGVAWNGLISVTESPSGAEPTPLYADDIKYLELMSAEELGGLLKLIHIQTNSNLVTVKLNSLLVLLSVSKTDKRLVWLTELLSATTLRRMNSVTSSILFMARLHLHQRKHTHQLTIRLKL